MDELDVRKESKMTVPYQEVFDRRASPFMRWCLSPVLLIVSAVFTIPLRDSMEAGDSFAVIVTSLLIILCVSGLLALWGVPFVGRIASGIIALVFGWYLVDQCFINFNGDWGIGKKRSETTPINSICGFLVFGLPCLIYTVFGRFTFRKEPEYDGDFDDFDFDDLNDDEPNKTKKCEQAVDGNPH